MGSEEIDSKTQQMIVFLTDGEPTEGETDGPTIKANVRQANAETKIPIYGLALGNGADFNLIKDISDESNGFAERIYEAGNSFEQLEDFYNKISDPKLKDVSFEYIVNGNRIVPESLTSSTINQVFGSNEYSIVGTLPENEEINMIEIVMKAKDQTGSVENLISLRPCILPVFPVPSPEFLSDEINTLSIRGSEISSTTEILSTPSTEISSTKMTIQPNRCFPIIPPRPIWEQSPTEKFMERLWAYKRINYLSDGNKDCSKGIDITVNDVLAENIPKADEEENEEPENECEAEAIRLALKYNFVTDLTSLVIEANDEYINKGPIQIGKKPTSPFNQGYPGLRAAGAYGASYSGYAYSPPRSSPPLYKTASHQLSAVSYSAGPPPPRNQNKTRRRRPSRPQYAAPQPPPRTTTYFP